MKEYLTLVKTILNSGFEKKNRTGMNALTIAGYCLKHDLRDGFPLLTTKKMGIKNIATELEGFIKGVTSKKWYQDRGCHIWDEWCNPQKVAYGNDEKTKKNMEFEDDLGKIYGYQWRKFNDAFTSSPEDNGPIYKIDEADQLKMIVERLKTNPSDRRMICSAWNPLQIDQMALPPCHVLWNLVTINDTLNLIWYQRSCDTMLGIPYNLASYALLLKLLAAEANMVAGEVCGMLADVHIYMNHIEGAEEQISREERPLPILTYGWKEKFNIFEFDSKKVGVDNYNPHPAIKFPIAV